LVLPPEIVMHDALMLFFERPPIYVSSCMTIAGVRTEQYVVIGFGELAAVD